MNRSESRKNPHPSLSVRGFQIFSGLIGPLEQKALVEQIRSLVALAPLFHPKTSRGLKMSVRMTSAGSVGWVSDRRGYRYEESHPRGCAWPPIPPDILAIWRHVTGLSRDPDSCLINFYDADAKMGMHQDKDENDFSWPVVSVSLGDDALFRMGNVERGGKTDSIWLKSGDVVVMGGAARLAHHGVDRIRAGSSTLLQNEGRINLTLRVVSATEGHII
ncbi:UNVERIFIED_CONTAM: hypothetical protein GTU68_018701 [Idotea baltica]|nr:hypothetical protein [Idotea baltica]